MILIITRKDDFTADYIITGLQKKNIEYLRFNTEDMLEESKSSVQFGKDICSTIIRDYSQFRSVLFRRTKLPDINAVNTSVAHFYDVQNRSFIDNLWSVIDSKWISNPFYIYRAENKLLQLKIAQKQGWLIPSTLVTTDNSRIKRFYDELDGQVIIKPLNRNRVNIEEGVYTMYTNEVAASHIDNINDYLPIPTILQEKISKQYELRVTVVGNEVFAAKVDSQSIKESKTDWRKSDLPFTATTLPEEIANKCIAITKELSLEYGAIDLAYDENGSYVFFEINPVGQFVWIELQTGMPITNSLINILTS